MRRFLHIATVVMATGLSTGPARAQGVSLGEIGPSVLAGAHGSIAVNNSAGTGNTQSNQAAISVGGQQAEAGLHSMQQPGQDRPGLHSAGRQASLIGAGAFAGASGVVAVNQSSGSGNAQANMAGIAVAPVAEATIDHLAAVRAPRSADAGGGRTTAQVRGERSAIVSDSAFAGAAGVVQVNQIAGSGNSTLNAFAMSIGASPR